MRLALIVNRKSGTGPVPSHLAALLAAGGAHVRVTAIDELVDGADSCVTPAALDFAKRALSADGLPDRVVITGGDGSIGLPALLAADLNVPLAVVPVGTANDFARNLGLPLELEAACALARSPHATRDRAELALANGRPFVNAAAAGLSVLAARHAQPLKARLGPLAYPVAALRAGATAAPLHCHIRCDGQERFTGTAWQVIIAATGAFGGGSEIGGTSPDDRLLDIAIIPPGPRHILVRRAWGMRRGRLNTQHDLTLHRASTIDIAVEGSTFNIDGENCRYHPAHFELRPGGFEVLVGDDSQRRRSPAGGAH